jgi:hypothetical protein
MRAVPARRHAGVGECAEPSDDAVHPWLLRKFPHHHTGVDVRVESKSRAGGQLLVAHETPIERVAEVNAERPVRDERQRKNVRAETGTDEV